MTNQTAETHTGAQPMVYIRPVALADLPEDLRAQAEEAGAPKTLYAIGDEDGQQLALVKDRKLAFVVARQNDMQPVSVH